MKKNVDQKENLLKFINCGIEFTTPIIVSVMLGIWIDKKFNFFPMFLVIFLLIGCAAGYANIKRYLENA